MGGDHRLGGKGLDQSGALGDIGPVDGGLDEAEGIAQGIDTRVNLGGHERPITYRLL